LGRGLAAWEGTMIRLLFAAAVAAMFVLVSAPTFAPSPLLAEAATKAKTKKAPSAKQIAARQRMKECGAEWRALKKAKKTEGKTWRAFAKECLKSKKK
jgi:hypothetical protein